MRDVRNALVRIENKTYGLCKVTGKLINKRKIKNRASRYDEYRSKEYATLIFLQNLINAPFGAFFCGLNYYFCKN